MSRRILVTGGAGFVGSAIADALQAAGDAVVVVDDLATGDRANVSGGIELVIADAERVRLYGRNHLTPRKLRRQSVDRTTPWWLAS